MASTMCSLRAASAPGVLRAVAPHADGCRLTGIVRGPSGSQGEGCCAFRHVAIDGRSVMGAVPAKGRASGMIELYLKIVSERFTFEEELGFR